MINEKLDYEKRFLNPTSRLSARRPPAPASFRFKSAVLKLPHLNQVALQKKDSNKADHRNHNNAQQGQQHGNTSMAFQADQSGRKHHQNENEKKKQKNEKNGSQYQYGRLGQQIQLHGEQQSTSSKCCDAVHTIRGYDCDMIDDSTIDTLTNDTQLSVQHAKQRKGHKRVRVSVMSGCYPLLNSQQASKVNFEVEKPQPQLLPRARSSGIHTADRRKNARLNGADLYVARLGRSENTGGRKKKIVLSKASATTTAPTADSEASQSSTTPMRSTSHSNSGSLHDELINKIPSTPPLTTCSLEHNSYPDNVLASRPCYRCITYMDSVGIKRVFWTNDAGQWEGGKVRDLIDALDNSMGAVSNGGPTDNGIFVTKHEVLMLKRMMG